MSKAPQKPTKLLALEGKRDRKGQKASDKLKEEPRYKPLSTLNPPDYLTEEAQNIWKEYAPIVHRVGLLTEADKRSFALLCIMEAWLVQLDAEVAGKDFGIPEYTVDPTGQEHMKVKVDERRKEFRQLAAARLKYAQEFGMVPKGRVGLTIGTKAKDKEDPMGIND